MPIKQEKLLAAARRMAADIMHSDDDLAQRLEPATPEVPSPEAGSSNDELVENSHTENGQSPVLDGEIKSPERANVNAVREAIETQAEMEVGKPIEQKQEEVAVAEAKADEAAASGTSVQVGNGKSGEVTVTVQFKLNGRLKQALFSSKAAGDAFVKAASEKFADKIEFGKGAAKITRGSPSMQELEENSHTENGGSPVLDGDPHSSERPNVNAMREALETQQEMEVGKPISEKEKELEAKAEKPIEVESGSGKQIIINIAAFDVDRAISIDPKPAQSIGGEKQHPRDVTSRGNQGTGMFGGTDLSATPNMERHASLAKMAGDFWGYDGWITGHTALMINNDSVPYTTLKRLVRNALKKKMSPKELAAQLARFFKKQAQESAKFYAENAADARGQRGKYEQQQLEGKPPEPSGNKARDVVEQLTGLWYEGGGRSGWEEPVGEVDWEDIAASEMEKERAENPKAYPQTSERDDKFVKSVGIKMESLKAAKAALAKVGKMADNEPKGAQHPSPAEDETEQACRLAGEGAAKTPEEIEKEAGFNFFFPGQALREIAPELQHELVDYPNDTNTPMLYPDITGDTQEVPEEVAIAAAVEEALNPTIIAYVSTSPAGAAGIGRDGKPEVLEGAPLRKENDIRGMMFTDEFYGQQEAVPGHAFASKQAFLKAIMVTDEAKLFGSAFACLKVKVAGTDEAKQFSLFLKRVCGEIAATLVALFRVTSRPLLDKVPGIGEIQLAQVEQPQGLSSFNIYNTGSRVKYLMDKLTDSEIRDAINGSSAQGAVWHDGDEGGYVYEVFVRIDDIDTESMIATYSFICGTKE